MVLSNLRITLDFDTTLEKPTQRSFWVALGAAMRMQGVRDAPGSQGQLGKGLGGLRDAAACSALPLLRMRSQLCAQGMTSPSPKHPRTRVHAQGSRAVQG